MKKLSVIFLAALFVFGIAGQAGAAAYTYGELVQVIYEGTTDSGFEFHTGIGSVKTGELTLPRKVDGLFVPSQAGPPFVPAVDGQPSTDLADFDTDDFDELYIGFTSQYTDKVLVSGSGRPKYDYTYHTFFASTSSVADEAAMINGTYFTTYSNNSAGFVTTADSGPADKGEATNPTSYWEKIEYLSGTGNIQGAASGMMNLSGPMAFASLGILDDDLGSGDDTGSPVIGRYVDMYLYQYSEFDPDQGATVRGFKDINGDWNDTYVAKIRIGIQDDGSGDPELYTELVPIPGTVLLLASGLLGLFGFRRKRA
jgi:hypothetical protein